MKKSKSKLIYLIVCPLVFILVFVALVLIVPLEDGADVDATTTRATTTVRPTTTKSTTTKSTTTTTKPTTTTTVKPTTTTTTQPIIPDDPPVHVHTEVIDPAVEATCTETGLTEGKHCSECEEIIVAQEVVPATGHTEAIDSAVAPTCQKTGLAEGKHCSGCDEIFLAQEEVPVIECIASDWIIDKEATINEDGSRHKECTMCGKRMSEEADEIIPILSGSVGLTFKSNGDETYSVTGIGECQDTVLMIPRYYEGLPVTSIVSEAFAQCYGITSVVMPDSITSIGDGAFQQCTSLKSITWSNSLKSIGNQAFGLCSSLENITLPDSVETIGILAFYNCTSLTSVIIPGGVKEVAGAAFAGCTSLTAYCESESKPEKWHSQWFTGNIEWGYTAE